MLKLADLEPKFLKILDDRTEQMQDEIAGADGLWFLCPKCFTANKGRVGTHGVICWRPHVPQTRSPRPGRWEFTGTGFNDLSLVAGSSSVKLMGGCEWHGFVTNGEVTTC